MEYKIIEESYGTVSKTYDVPRRSGETECYMIIDTDRRTQWDPKTISELNKNREFHIGQQVVSVALEYELPATDFDEEEYEEIGKECPDNISHIVHVVFDAAQYRSGLCDLDAVVQQDSREFYSGRSR